MDQEERNDRSFPPQTSMHHINQEQLWKDNEANLFYDSTQPEKEGKQLDLTLKEKNFFTTKSKSLALTAIIQLISSVF